MTNEQNNTIASELQNLITTGTEEQVRDYIRLHFDELPEDLRNELMAASLANALDEINRQRDSVVAIQEQGIKALKVLDEWEKEPEELTNGEGIDK